MIEKIKAAVTAMGAQYIKDFYKLRDTHTRESARQIVSYVIEYLKPKSVVDVGCGAGTWLSEFKKQGCARVLGMDSNYVSREYLQISPREFQVHNLSLPLAIKEKFDLALCLEVAEHLPGNSAEILVDSLTGLRPVVLFSAAIPGQDGEHHINEQWQEYWRQIFASRGYLCLQGIRDFFWNNPDILYWYRQNMLLYVEESYYRDSGLSSKERVLTGKSTVSVVHPEAYKKICLEFKALAMPPCVSRAAAMFLQAGLNFLKRQRKT